MVNSRERKGNREMLAAKLEFTLRFQLLFDRKLSTHAKTENLKLGIHVLFFLSRGHIHSFFMQNLLEHHIIGNFEVRDFKFIKTK